MIIETVMKDPHFDEWTLGIYSHNSDMYMGRYICL